MRIAHLSDLHAGYATGRKNDKQGINIREADGYRALAAVVRDVIAHEVDAVIIAGDVFHAPIPSMRTIIFVQNQMRLLAKAGIPVYMLAGNHDSSDIKHEIASSRVLDDPFRNIYSTISPWEVKEVAPGVFVHMISHHMYSQQSDTMAKVKPVKGAVNILTTHGSVIDPILRIKLHNNQSPREVVIPDHIVQMDWDCVMLGHIHERKFVAPEENDYGFLMLYNGSLIRRGFSDAEGTLGRGWTLWTINPDGSFTHKFRNIAQRPQYDFALDATGMSASQITEKIVENLKSTQTQGNQFIISKAPILRQTISNISPSTVAGIDHKAIEMASAHALSWQMRTRQTARMESKKEESGREGDTIASDLVGAYEKWAATSGIIEAIDEKLRDQVVKNARNFVALGVDEVLGEEA